MPKTVNGVKFDFEDILLIFCLCVSEHPDLNPDIQVICKEEAIFLEDYHRRLEKVIVKVFLIIKESDSLRKQALMFLQDAMGMPVDEKIFSRIALMSRTVPHGHGLISQVLH